MEAIIQMNKFDWLNESVPVAKRSALTSFAMDDVLSEAVGKEAVQAAALHSWAHHPTVVVGIQDQRLPYFKDAVRFLKEAGYDVVMRNSGGLAVVLDEGVYNLSLLINVPLGINEGYELMQHLIEQMFDDLTQDIVAKEIPQSYCPGSYDLSIAGKKFAGISQRRANGAIAVQIYLSIEGDQAKRAHLIRDFYAIGRRGEETRLKYPEVDSRVMGTLTELLATPLSLAAVNERLLTTLNQRGYQRSERILTTFEQERYQVFEERLAKRNEQISNY